jgi:succinate dehydrogenase / fumarate reductase, membrane anchor subunit
MGNGTSIGRVRGLGAAHSGVHHWLVIRYTAIGSLLLTAWFAASLLMLPNLGYGTVREWLARPVPATAMALFVIVNIWHAKLGVQVVIEDYVHEHANKFASMVALNLAAFAGAAFGVFCVARLALGGA